MDKQIYNISESEVEVMKMLWDKSPLTSRQIIDRMDHDLWSENTIKTFINRLLKKGAIKHVKEGRGYLYYPNITYDEFLAAENDLFLNKVYSGAVEVLLSKFVKEAELTMDSIDKLQSILNEKKLQKKQFFKPNIY